MRFREHRKGRFNAIEEARLPQFQMGGSSPKAPSFLSPARKRTAAKQTRLARLVAPIHPYSFPERSPSCFQFSPVVARLRNLPGVGDGEFHFSRGRDA